MRGLIFAFIFALTLAPSAGCSLESSLENAPCKSDDDCVGEQTCVGVPQAASGLCRSDGSCVPGEQEGCIADGESCTGGLVPVMDGDGVAYCCSTCVEGAETEPCLVGGGRCIATAGTLCGCQVPASEIEDTPCDDAASCGEGFVCTRTLEQEAEPLEVQPEDQMVEPGQCRPEEAPQCVTGLQEGCRAESGCPGGGLDYLCAGSRCYCCDSPSNSNEYSVHVYAQTELGESAACIECSRDACETTSTCTAIEDSDCIVANGEACGCMPA